MNNKTLKLYSITWDQSVCTGQEFIAAENIDELMQLVSGKNAIKSIRLVGSVRVPLMKIWNS